MNSAQKALWYIETHLAEDIALDAVAEACGVSRFHLTRAFGAATGYPIMRYLRGRRLSEAARSLAVGAGDILAVALDAGYGSHEAFTRAFRDQFGLTPETVRGQRRVDNLALVEPIAMNDTPLAHLEPPRFEDGKPLLIAGFSHRYTWETNAGIPAQWQRFVPHIGHVPAQVGEATYGVCCNSDDAGNFDYICGVEVADFADLPVEFARIRIGAQRYAVFTHRDHISTMRRTVYTIWNKWLPESEHSVADAPDFERYRDFDAEGGTGIIEIWIPLQR
jgi:AraC family transcriptional regulator